MLLPRPPRRRGPLALSLVAMVDVVMNLLFFFMMAARFPAWRTLPLELGGAAPAPSGAQAVLAPPVRLTLLPTGRLEWDGRPLPRGEVENRLAAEPARLVRVAALAGVPFQDTLALIEGLRQVSRAVTLDVPERVAASASASASVAGPGAGLPAPASSLPTPDTLGVPAPDSGEPREPSIADFLPGGPAAPSADRPSGSPVTPAAGTGTGAGNGNGNGGPLPPPPPDPGAQPHPARAGYIPDRPPAITYDPGAADRPASSVPAYDDPYWTREKPAPRNGSGNGNGNGSAGTTPPPDSGN